MNSDRIERRTLIHDPSKTWNAEHVRDLVDLFKQEWSPIDADVMEEEFRVSFSNLEMIVFKLTWFSDDSPAQNSGYSDLGSGFLPIGDDKGWE